MATRKTITATPPSADTTQGMPPGADPEAWGALVTQRQNPIQTLEEAEEDAEMDIGERLRSAFGNDIGSSVRVCVYRLEGPTRKRLVCRAYTPDEFIEGGFDLVRREYGEGDYEFRSYGTRGLIPGGRGTFSIAKTMAPTATPQAAQGSSELGQILAVLVQGQRDTQAMIQAMAQRPQEDPAQALQNTLAMVRTMREVFAPPVPPVAPLVAPVDPLAQITQLAGAMRAMRDISTEFNPPSDADPLMSALGPILGMVGDAVKSRTTPANTDQDLPLLSAPASIASATAPATSTDEQPQANDMGLLVLKGAIAKLVALATANADPKDGGNFIHNSLPDDLLMYLDYPNWFEILAQFAPELTPHRTWVEAAKAHADTLFASDPAG
jgi:hypothetical protein